MGIYSDLPDVMTSSKVTWRMFQFDAFSGNYTNFDTMDTWITFLVEFVREQWRDEDWVPSFDMILTYPLDVHKRFRGSLGD